MVYIEVAEVVLDALCLEGRESRFAEDARLGSELYQAGRGAPQLLRHLFREDNLQAEDLGGLDRKGDPIGEGFGIRHGRQQALLNVDDDKRHRIEKVIMI